MRLRKEKRGGVLSSNKIKSKIVGPSEAENRKAEFLIGVEIIGDHVQTDDGKLITAISPAWLAIYNKLIEDPELPDQCKAYGRGHLVGLGDVREMQGVLAADPYASKAVISTTSQFAKGVKESEEFQRAVPYRLELREGDDLIRWLLKYQDKC